MLFTLIVTCITVDLGKKSGFVISFPSEKKIKINHKIYDLEKDDCSIDIKKRHELLHKVNDVLEKNITGTQDNYTSVDEVMNDLFDKNKDRK